MHLIQSPLFLLKAALHSWISAYVRDLLVHDVFDILMHCVVIAPFVRLDVEGDLQKRRWWKGGLFSAQSHLLPFPPDLPHHPRAVAKDLLCPAGEWAGGTPV